MQTKQPLTIQVGAFILALAMPLSYAAAKDEPANENGAAAEQSKAEDSQAQGDEQKEGGIGQAFSDATATASIKTRLMLNSETDAKNIHVTTMDGKVVLEGDVASAAERDKATEIARNTNGVTEVQNKLHVASMPAGGEGKEESKENQG